jgi:hypothetical protein
MFILNDESVRFYFLLGKEILKNKLKKEMTV